MVNVSDLRRSNKGRGSKFNVGSQVQQETPEEYDVQGVSK